MRQNINGRENEGVGRTAVEFKLSRDSHDGKQTNDQGNSRKEKCYRKDGNDGDLNIREGCVEIRRCTARVRHHGHLVRVHVD